MKMIIQRNVEFIVNTAAERSRIKKCWKPTETTYKKLMKLMDLIEAEKWQEAEEFLDSKWWKGKDKQFERPRLEFIGMLDAEGAEPWDTYRQLIWKMNRYRDIYKVVGKVK